jgi:hypothetical protein
MEVGRILFSINYTFFKFCIQDFVSNNISTSKFYKCFQNCSHSFQEQILFETKNFTFLTYFHYFENKIKCYIYIYIYVCVCVCVCVSLSTSE